MPRDDEVINSALLTLKRTLYVFIRIRKFGIPVQIPNIG